MRRLCVCASLALTILTAFASATIAQPGRSQTYDAFFTFGDSLADTGNTYLLTRGAGFNPAIPPSESPNRLYFDGRFTNDRVAFEYLWNMLRASGRATGPSLQPFLALPRTQPRTAVDFAFGGSGAARTSVTPGGFEVPGLRGQVELFLSLRPGRISNRALVGIITGSNDYLRLPPAAPANPADVVADIIIAIEQLHARGARTVVVVDVGDLGQVPLVAGDPEASAALSQLAAAHNALLADALVSLRARSPLLQIVDVRVADLIAALPPGLNVTIPAVDLLVPQPWPTPFPPSVCLFFAPGACPDVPTFDAGDAFYWDAVHPTDTVHLALAQYLFTRVP
jgi:phospholipase/lecithinase/hemolysin